MSDGSYIPGCFVEGDGDMCNDCGTYTVLDVQTYVCESCYNAACDRLADQLLEEGGGDPEETQEERDFRLAEAALESAHGLLEAEEDTGKRERIREAINAQAWGEIAEFLQEDDRADYANRYERGVL